MRYKYYVEQLADVLIRYIVNYLLESLKLMNNNVEKTIIK